MQTAKERADIESASDNLDVLRQQRAQLEAEFAEETKALEASADPSAQKIDVSTQTPKKSDVAVRLIALVWLPHWKTGEGEIHPAF
jgi:hypothetical protein